MRKGTAVTQRWCSAKEAACEKQTSVLLAAAAAAAACIHHSLHSLHSRHCGGAGAANEGMNSLQIALNVSTQIVYAMIHD